MKTYHWKSPSNIALVKYWGKHGVQLPANPSISFSLDACCTQTKLRLGAQREERISFQFEGESKPSFLPKLDTYVERISSHLPWLAEHSLDIDSSNTFPHSSGIASSASGMSALSLCLAEADADRKGTELDLGLASELARLGSGSACRSVYGGYTTWGASEHIEGSSDERAIPLTDIHPSFMDLRDTILLIDSGKKEVSSTVGHGLMHGHPFAEARFEQARGHIAKLKDILLSGDFEALATLIEREALTLHAMMMSSDPHFMLFKPGSISVIEKVLSLRKSGDPISFTLDAGANVHLIYPSDYEQKAMEIISHELVDYCEKGAYICDRVGKGPECLTT